LGPLVQLNGPRFRLIGTLCIASSLGQRRETRQEDAQPHRFAQFVVQGLSINGKVWLFVTNHGIKRATTKGTIIELQITGRIYATDTPVTGKVNRAGWWTLIGNAQGSWEVQRMPACGFLRRIEVIDW